MEQAVHKHTFSILVANRSGVLARVVGLFSRRGFNIESLAVGTVQNPTQSRITVVVEGDDRVLEQVGKQLHKLIDVERICETTPAETVSRELFLIKVKAMPEQRQEIITIANIFRAQVVDVGEESIILEVTGQQEKLDAIGRLLEGYSILEIVRTGRVVLRRGKDKT
jgi:acetolactate synthase I/III small subunit